MCGISAFFSNTPKKNMRENMRRSLSLIAHRGPDGSGIITGFGNKCGKTSPEVTPNWALGHVRLSIQDTSSAGAQPMSIENGKIWITYNGEIYNFIELRKELEGYGYHFKSGSDTEVLLYAYKQWRQDCVRHFVGMFAFVIVDLELMTVFAARDRLGVKPMYFWPTANQIVVVSEPKQLMALKEFRPQANIGQIVDFLVDDVVGHDCTSSFFKGVLQLSPGHILSWPLGELPDIEKSSSYWQPSLTPQNIGWSEAVEKTGTLIRTAVRERLISDVPVGSCLSGGIDSSTIVGIISKELNTPIHTFSACFPGFDFDEQFYMDEVTSHCKTEPIKIFPKEDELLRDLDSLVYHQDEPFGTLSLYAQWQVMKAAKRANIPVLLDGQGGDESLCGYKKYLFFYLKTLLADKQYLGLARHGYHMLFNGDQRIFDWKSGQRYLPKFLKKQTDNIYDSLSPLMKNYYRSIWHERMHAISSIKQHQLADLKMWSLPALLRYEDRNSMAHSIEARVPFVDHRFVEHCLSLPVKLLFQKGRSKRVLIEGVGNVLPHSIQTRRTKVGFETPQKHWFKGNLGKVLAERVSQSERIGEIVEKKAILNLFHSYRESNANVTDLLLFRIASLAMWLERFKVEV